MYRRWPLGGRPRPVSTQRELILRDAPQGLSRLSARPGADPVASPSSRSARHATRATPNDNRPARRHPHCTSSSRRRDCREPAAPSSCSRSTAVRRGRHALTAHRGIGSLHAYGVASAGDLGRYTTYVAWATPSPWTARSTSASCATAALVRRDRARAISRHRHRRGVGRSRRERDASSCAGRHPVRGFSRTATSCRRSRPARRCSTARARRGTLGACRRCCRRHDGDARDAAPHALGRATGCRAADSSSRSAAPASVSTSAMATRCTSCRAR